MKTKELSEVKKLPDKVEILGASYQVEFEDKVMSVEEEPNWIHGRIDTRQRVIYLSQTDEEDRPLPEDVIENNFYHELIHCILTEGMYCQSSADEPLVEWIGKNLQHLIKTKQL